MSAKWYLGTGAQNDVIISTCVHLARNLKECPFPSALSVKDKLKVTAQISAAAQNIDGYSFDYAEMKTLSRHQVVSLAERHLVSPEFAFSGDGRALLLTEDESVSIMLNEEDHIRLQVMYAGFSLDEAYKTADYLDDELSAQLPIAFDERLGYLTQSPSLLGTGMTASVVLHLPAIAASGGIQQLITAVGKLGLTLRGSYGEGADAKGDLFRLSNSITLGLPERAAVDNLKSIALQIAAKERAARDEMFLSPTAEDKLFRALGTLKYARLLDTDEFMELMSLVRLGAVRGLISLKTEVIEDMMIRMQPATLSLCVDRPLSKLSRDALRAELVRKALM